MPRGLEPRTSRPQAGLLLTRLRLALDSYYCTTCDMAVCDRCVIMGSDHRGHEIVQLADANAKTLSKLSTVQVRAHPIGASWRPGPRGRHAHTTHTHTHKHNAHAHAHPLHSPKQSEIQRRVETPTCGRAEAVYEGLAGLVDEAADDAVTHIEKLRRQAKAQLSSHKLKEVAHLKRNAEAMTEAAQGIAQVLAELPRGSRQASNPTGAQGQLVDQWQNKLTQATIQTLTPTPTPTPTPPLTLNQ